MSGTLLMALLMGLTGSLHCAGMCGAIMWAMPFYTFKGLARVLAFALYHLLRISAYAGMALFLFSFRDLFQPGIQQVISIGLGVLLLAAGIISFLPAMGTTISLPWAGFVKKQLAVFVGEAHMGKIAVSGFLNGLLPCGLVYVALSGSTQLHSPTQVIAYMYAFGAGTIPVLASIVFLRSKILLHMGGIRKLVPVVVFVFGCLFVVRGMNLGVPYLSPKVTAEKGCITHSCCHKK